MIENLIDGPLWYLSLAVFSLGVLWQLAAILFASRKPDLSVARGSAGSSAIKTVFSRFLPHREMRARIGIQYIAGYLFHLGLFALLFLPRRMSYSWKKTCSVSVGRRCRTGLSSFPHRRLFWV